MRRFGVGSDIGCYVNPIVCEFCKMPIDSTEPAESMIPEIAEGKYGKLVIGHSRCAVKIKKKMHRVGSFSVINVSDIC